MHKNPQPRSPLGRRIIVIPTKSDLNAPMQKNDLIAQLKDYLITEKACLQTVTCLSEKAEIGITIADSAFLRVLCREGEVQVEEQKAVAPDFIFTATPEAIEVLINEKGLSPAQLGIKLLKQILNQDIQLAMPANLFQISKKGYLNIIKVGGVEFLAELKNHNLASIPKIMNALKNLKK